MDPPRVGTGLSQGRRQGGVGSGVGCRGTPGTGRVPSHRPPSDPGTVWGGGEQGTSVLSYVEHTEKQYYGRHFSFPSVKDFPVRSPLCSKFVLSKLNLRPFLKELHLLTINSLLGERRRLSNPTPSPLSEVRPTPAARVRTGPGVRLYPVDPTNKAPLH